MMAQFQVGPPLRDSCLALRPGGIAAETIRAGDYCRVMDGNRVRRLRDGDSLRVTDCMAAHDAKPGERVEIVVDGQQP